MTVTEDRQAERTDALPEVEAPQTSLTEEDERPALQIVLRPALAAALSTLALGMVAGGIFGSWQARMVGALAALGGAGWTVLMLRSSRPGAFQAAFPVALLLAGSAALISGGRTPSELPSEIADAITSGRLLRPPVPFDPGWRPILVFLVGAVGFAASYVAAGMQRSKLGVAIPLPLVALTAITQPDDGQFIAGAVAFIPVLAALGVLFGGDANRSRSLGSDFELKRAARGGVGLIGVVALLLGLSSANFLFPEPVYDPTDQPQKPKSIPLSEAVDRVLFEVESDVFTGPWRTGVLDVYDAEDFTWKLPPFDAGRFVDLPAGGQVSTERADRQQLEVGITVNDLGNSAVLPTLGGVTRIDVTADAGLVVDPRTQLLRVRTGRVPTGLAYTMHVPAYATDADLRDAELGRDVDVGLLTDLPPPPDAVRKLLVEAPTDPWPRLDFMRQALLSTVTTVGAGAPKEMPPEAVQEIMAGTQEGSPFEIVATEAMLARWAGIPARIGFGFDGVNVEDDVLTVRPQNAAQWLEVHFDGFGWIPLVGTPDKAETSLDTDPARFDPNILPSDDVAVEVFVPFEKLDPLELFERIRQAIVRWAPLWGPLLALLIGWPLLAKRYRSAMRRRWAAGLGPREQVAVEYAEFRDLATDLGVADVYSTPLEYLFEVEEDAEHAEFSWLVARALYGDKRDAVTDEDARAAEEIGASMRRRIARGQPVWSQIVAQLSKASIIQPYSSEVPNVPVFSLPRPWRRLRGWRGRWAARRRRRREMRRADRALAAKRDEERSTELVGSDRP